MRPLRPLCLVVVAAVAAGCFDVERRATSTVPDAWLGEWQGDWQSRSGSGSGTMRLWVRAFEERPVVYVESTHPCLRPASYRFELHGPEWRLLADGKPVFVGVLDPAQRRVAGDYRCAEDDGAWQVRWQRELPGVVDLGGIWDGVYVLPAATAAGDLELDLDQSWAAGRLVLGGRLWLRGPELPELELPVAYGSVTFAGDDFRLELRTDPTRAPAVLLQGVGRGAVPAVCEGLLLVGLPGAPPWSGLWSASRVGP